MDRIKKVFLYVLCSHIRQQDVSDEIKRLSNEELMILYRMSITHSVFPMFYDVISHTDSFDALTSDLKRQWKRQAIATVAEQTVKSERFRKLYRKITGAGLNCLVVKGIVCRHMYPKPDLRSSNDEDIYISSDEFLICHNLLLENGMRAVDKVDTDNIKDIHVVSYVDSATGLHIELHQTLFEEDSKAYGYMNSYFKDSFKKAVSIQVDGNILKTLEYTENMLYLICHAFKHFVMRGFGLRQLCDILLFAENYGDRINWNYIEKTTKEIGADVFFVNLLDIGKRYLEFSKEKACMREVFESVAADSDDLLEDLLDAGVFGKSSDSRLHSNSMTLNAMERRETASNSKKAALGALFPRLDIMKKRYTILNRLPFLLPVMWIVRLFSFLFSKKKDKNNSAMDTLALGNKRIELLKKYKIIK